MARAGDPQITQAVISTSMEGNLTALKNEAADETGTDTCESGGK
jgi:hypothetical protein